MRRLFLLLLILLGVYIAYPYWTLHRLEQALLSNNAEVVKKIVDFPAVRASLKSQVEGGLLEKSEQLGEKRPVLGDIGTALTNLLGPSVIGGTVDSLVTPEALLNNPTVVEHREKDEGFGDNITYAFFSRPTTFQVDFKNPNKTEAPNIKAEMTLDGLRWRVTHVELPPLESIVPSVN
ncbi:MAG: DUF2939 domain-containing protein [Pseudomonadota bacterium]